MMRLYLDANPIIYSIEGIPEFREAVLEWIQRAEAADGAIVTSRLSRLECRVKPLRDGQEEMLAQYEGFFEGEGLEVLDVSAEVIERATELRARHGFRTPDAIHLASALIAGADVFLTADRNLRTCPGLDVALVESPR